MTEGKGGGGTSFERTSSATNRLTMKSMSDATVLANARAKPAVAAEMDDEGAIKTATPVAPRSCTGVNERIRPDLVSWSSIDQQRSDGFRYSQRRKAS